MAEMTDREFVEWFAREESDRIYGHWKRIEFIAAMPEPGDLRHSVVCVATLRLDLAEARAQVADIRQWMESRGVKLESETLILPALQHEYELARAQVAALTAERDAEDQERLLRLFDQYGVECQSCGVKIIARGGPDLHEEKRSLTESAGDAEAICGHCAGEEIARLESELHVETGARQGLDGALATTEKRYLKAAEELKAAKQDTARLADRIVREVAEIPDRFSPEDDPRMMLVRDDELRTIIISAMLAARAPESCPHCTDGVQVTADSENRIHTRPCPHCAACAPEGTTATDSAGKREG